MFWIFMPKSDCVCWCWKGRTADGARCMVPALARWPLFPSAHTQLSLLTSFEHLGHSAAICVPPWESWQGTPYQIILKVEFRHELGVGICLLLLLLSGTCPAAEAGFAGLCLHCSDDSS